MTSTESFTWHTNPAAVFAFASVLHAADEFAAPADVLDFFEKPHKWDPEHQTWNGLGSPTHGDPRWDEFCAGLDERDSSPS